MPWEYELISIPQWRSCLLLRVCRSLLPHTLLLWFITWFLTQHLLMFPQNFSDHPEEELYILIALISLGCTCPFNYTSQSGKIRKSSCTHILSMVVSSITSADLENKYTHCPLKVEVQIKGSVLCVPTFRTYISNTFVICNSSLKGYPVFY